MTTSCLPNSPKSLTKGMLLPRAALVVRRRWFVPSPRLPAASDRHWRHLLKGTFCQHLTTGCAVPRCYAAFSREQEDALWHEVYGPGESWCISLTREGGMHCGSRSSRLSPHD